MPDPDQWSEGKGRVEENATRNVANKALPELYTEIKLRPISSTIPFRGNSTPYLSLGPSLSKRAFSGKAICSAADLAASALTSHLFLLTEAAAAKTAAPAGKKPAATAWSCMNHGNRHTWMSACPPPPIRMLTRHVPERLVAVAKTPRLPRSKLRTRRLVPR